MGGVVCEVWCVRCIMGGVVCEVWCVRCGV